jgi:lactate permease
MILDILHWLMACSPILVLFIALLWLRINAALAGLIAMLAAGALSYFVFGGNSSLLAIAIGKGLSLAFFVLLIIWSSLLLYNLMSRLGLIHSIASTIARLMGNSLGQALMCGWAFAGFIEGVAGFGVPVAVIAPLMVALGFNPLLSAVIVLVGHSWAVTYGGMAAAYYTLLLATGLPTDAVGPTMAVLFCLPVLATGLSVAHIHGGWAEVRKSAPAVLVCALVMSSCVWLAAILEVPQITAIIAGLAGCLAIWLISKTRWLNFKNGDIATARPAENGINFHLAFMPYYVLIFVALVCQIPAVKQASQNLYLAFSFSGAETTLGYVVEPVGKYAKISLLGHPAPIILFAFLITILTFYRSRYWKNNAVLGSLKATAHQCILPSFSVLTVVVMALIMNDSGMTNTLAVGIARATGVTFPVFSPYIGVLGCFMTGSNTNSNVMFGHLQMEAATRLGINQEIITSTQSIGGSLGASIAPAKVLLGASAVNLSGGAGDIIRKTLKYCLIIAFIVGIQTLIVVNI